MTAPYVNSFADPLVATTIVRTSNMVGGQDQVVGAFQLQGLTTPVQYNAPLTGASIQLVDQAGVLVLEPAGTIATLTVTMPVNPFNNQQVRFTSTATVTALTVSAAAGQTLAGTIPTTIGAATSTHFDYVYITSTAKWYPV